MLRTTALGMDLYQAPAHHLEPGIHAGNAILSRFPLVEGHAWALPAPPRDTPRQLLHAVAVAPCGRIPVFVTHLSWHFHATGARLAQVQAIAELMLEVAPFSGFPPLLMGDMNAEPDADEMRYLRGLTAAGGREVYLADCFAVRGEGPGVTFSRQNGHAARERYPDRRIDYIYSRGPDRLGRGEPLAARVVLDRPGPDGLYPSDHFGVYAEVRCAPA